MRGSESRITLWGIEVFSAVVREGTVSAAARRLGTSLATISQQITNLENALGVTLLDRSQRPLALTPRGEIFLRRANTILNEADLARAELTSADLTQLRRLRLGMIEDFDADVTPALLARMGTELRECQFLLETGASHRLLGLLEERALDVIVTAALDGMEGYDVYPLLEEPFIVAAPKGASHGDLSALPFVQYTKRHLMGRTIAQHLKKSEMQVQQQFELDSYHAILSMVAAGAGWTILTPLGWQRAHRFRWEVDILPLPTEPLSRRIVVCARPEILGSLPAEIATQLRLLLNNMIIEPVVADLPWLETGLHGLD